MATEGKRAQWELQLQPAAWLLVAKASHMAYHYLLRAAYHWLFLYASRQDFFLTVSVPRAWGSLFLIIRPCLSTPSSPHAWACSAGRDGHARPPSHGRLCAHGCSCRRGWLGIEPCSRVSSEEHGKRGMCWGSRTAWGWDKEQEDLRVPVERSESRASFLLSVCL